MVLDLQLQMFNRVTSAATPPLYACNPGGGVLPGAPLPITINPPVSPTRALCPLWALEETPQYYYYQPEAVGQTPSAVAGGQLLSTLYFSLARGLGSTDLAPLLSLLQSLGVPVPQTLPSVPYLESFYVTDSAQIPAMPLPGALFTLLQSKFPALDSLGANGLLYLNGVGQWNQAQPTVGNPMTSKSVYLQLYQDPWTSDPVVSAWHALNRAGAYVPLMVYMDAKVIVPSKPIGDPACGQWVALDANTYLIPATPVSIRNLIADPVTGCIINAGPV